MNEQTHKRTTFYRRWNISHSVKNGWEPKDMTVSATFEEGKEPTPEQMKSLAASCIEEAQQVCDGLNAQESQVAQLKKAGQES